ncbi:anaphase-promoting complex, subunit 10-domain-containing protein [Kockovaella imperatae]|uniref:Anaphase-promoting complex, subunit 10-domain-containing protein n=1 Tax=Kockovaella imperatae TaxID=4999 RepID=A0A1Y1UNL0_9TREE|nr:anaphase-promoting complex, subunit 10-domain-containing protein [Kockovaella imperatae]ORX39107.1 anaphase-promoting complex, subunit 10-domain-containing protein [Kockovaella imperatae]
MEDVTFESTSTDVERPELGHLPTWSVSTHKYGFGVDNLRDGNDNTFWQSEGPQPHTIDLSFPKRVFISAISLHTSHPRDDSYTPSKISIKAGTSIHDLQEVRFCEFSKPNGWMHIPLRPMDSSSEGQEIDGPPIPAHHLRILILANHLNGKDTHVRGLKVFGSPVQANAPSSLDASEANTPTRATAAGKRLLELGHDGLSDFTSQQFKMHEFIR